MNKQPLTVEDLELVIRIHQKVLELHNRLLLDIVTQVNSLTDAHNAEKQ